MTENRVRCIKPYPVQRWMDCKVGEVFPHARLAEPDEPGLVHYVRFVGYGVGIVMDDAMFAEHFAPC